MLSNVTRLLKVKNFEIVTMSTLKNMEVIMDNVTLKKKLITYTSDKGYLKNVSEEVLHELLLAWENWIGTSKEFYSSLGFSQCQMASLIGKEKKYKREGYFIESEFKQIQIEPELPNEISPTSTCSAAEVVMSDGKVIRSERKNNNDLAKTNKILDLMDSIKEAIDYLNGENNF